MWTDYLTTGLDNLSGLWLPDTHYVYGDKAAEYNLSNTQTLDIQMRVMVTVNDINPNCYMLSKILDIVPKGILKISMKADDYNKVRDNVELKICDYYNDNGNPVIDYPTIPRDPQKTSEIYYAEINSDGELEYITPPRYLEIGKTYYLYADFSQPGVVGKWEIKINDEEADAYTDSEEKELIRLMVLRDVDDHTVSLKVSKSNKLKGAAFRLYVSDYNGDYKSFLGMEVHP